MEALDLVAEEPGLTQLLPRLHCLPVFIINNVKSGHERQFLGDQISKVNQVRSGGRVARENYDLGTIVLDVIINFDKTLTCFQSCYK